MCVGVSLWDTQLRGWPDLDEMAGSKEERMVWDAFVCRSTWIEGVNV